MIDLSISVVVLQEPQTSQHVPPRFTWKVSRPVKRGRLFISGTEVSQERALQAASEQGRILMAYSPESAGVE